jgi:uncharacterized tellurite resistance protein B-like protein
MIIFGSRGVTYSAGNGEFHCPHCNGRRYVKKRGRRFFTLYFIPLIPMDLLAEINECQTCKGNFRPEVLNYAPSLEPDALEVEFQKALKRIMVLVMLADGKIDDAEVEAVVGIYNKSAREPITEEEVRNEVKLVMKEHADVASCLAKVAPHLNDNGKEMLVKAAFLVAGADNDVADQERAIITEIAGALQISKLHLKGIVDDLAGKH